MGDTRDENIPRREDDVRGIAGEEEDDFEEDDVDELEEEDTDDV
jgi:hypothetical protein